MTRKPVWAAIWCALIGVTLVTASCVTDGAVFPNRTTPVPTPVGEMAWGRVLIRNYGCGACHTIPGILGADTHVAPSLEAFAARRYIAGVLINTPENLLTWIQDPRGVQPDTAMPNVGVSEADARDIAAYLYALR